MKNLRWVLAGVACLLGVLVPAKAWTGIEWTSAPGEAEHGQGYFVQARGWSDSGSLYAVSVWKAGAPFAFNGGGNGWEEWSGNPTSDGGEQWVEFAAEAYDNDGGSGVIYYSIHIKPPSNPPGIAWSSAPAEVESGETHFIEAHGWDADGNLATVSVWREWNPFAFAGGGNGWDGWSGNSPTDQGEQWITYQAESGDSTNNLSGVIYHTVHIKPPPIPQFPPAVYWDVAPGSVSVGQAHHIQAHGEDPDGDMQCVLIWLEGQPFAFELDGNGYYATSGNGGYNDAPGQVTYMAEAYDSRGVYSAKIYHQVWVTNSAPTSGVNPMLFPAALIVGINQPYTITSWANDSDNNLNRMEVFWVAQEEQPDGSYQVHYSGIIDTVTSQGGQPISKDYPKTGGKPFRWKYWYSAEGVDNLGWRSAVWSFNTCAVELDNHRPSDPVLTSTQTTIGLGQPVVITSYLTDENANLTDHWLWYQKPSEAGTSIWHYLDQHVMPQGEGNSTITYTFLPDELGTYRLKTRGTDPYESSIDVDVTVLVQDQTAPNPPTNVHAGGVFSDRIQILWDLSNSNDVVSYRLYWQPIAGGTLNNVTLGINTVGYWVTFLPANTAFRFYLHAHDGAGNISLASNQVQATTAFSSTDWDGDGIPDVVETLFTSDPQNQGVTDPSNATLKLKILKP